MITQEYLKQILHYDPETGLFTWLVSKSSSAFAGRTAGTLKQIGYRVIVINRKSYYEHRLAWLYETGYFPKEMIDHIDGAKSNNKFNNLREATRQQNSQNQAKSKRNKSGYKGVWFKKQYQKWNAAIRISGVFIHLGYFATPEEASLVYEAAAKKYFGEFYYEGK